MIILFNVFIGSLILAIIITYLDMNNFNVKSAFTEFTTDLHDLWGLGGNKLEDESNNNKNKT